LIDDDGVESKENKKKKEEGKKTYFSIHTYIHTHAMQWYGMVWYGMICYAMVYLCG
jgi:hypothetical protein